MTLVRQLSECRRSLGLDKEVKNPLNLGWEWWYKLGLDPEGVDFWGSRDSGLASCWNV